LQAISDNESANGLKVLTVNDKESKNQVLSFINNESYTFTVLLDSSGEVNTLYNVKYYPTTFFINSDGVIKKVVEGSFQDKTTIENILKTIQ
jgi:peroxiredoxin